MRQLLGGGESGGRRKRQTRYRTDMCRSIKRLREGTVAASEEEIRAAALQFVRKVSGFREPSRRNVEAFERAVDEVATASRQLLQAVTV